MQTQNTSLKDYVAFNTIFPHIIKSNPSKDFIVQTGNQVLFSCITQTLVVLQPLFFWLILLCTKVIFIFTFTVCLITHITISSNCTLFSIICYSLPFELCNALDAVPKRCTIIAPVCKATTSFPMVLWQLQRSGYDPRRTCGCFKGLKTHATFPLLHVAISFLVASPKQWIVLSHLRCFLKNHKS